MASLRVPGWIGAERMWPGIRHLPVTPAPAVRAGPDAAAGSGSRSAVHD
jgi:hypothetical protein